MTWQEGQVQSLRVSGLYNKTIGGGGGGREQTQLPANIPQPHFQVLHPERTHTHSTQDAQGSI